MKKMLATALLFSGVALAANADEVQMIETYAHPTMFGDAQIQSVENSSYVVGGKMMKTKNRIGFKNKNNVLVDSWVKDILAIIKDESSVNGAMFDPKLPVLRSELAVIIAEGFKIQKPLNIAQYKDVTSKHWAQDWIYKTTASKIMIGYPDNNFRPDQPVTKAEVFATIAQMVDVKYDKAAKLPNFNGKTIQYIPTWANNATKEVINSELLDNVPTPDKVNNDEYLSKEQVAYLIGTLRNELGYRNGLAKDTNAPDVIKKYSPICLNVKLNNRVSAKHSNIGDKFTSTLTKDMTIANQEFAAGSKVIGQVVEVKRPGYKDPGYVKVKFLNIKDGDKSVDFPANISEAEAVAIKNPNFVARLLAFPFSVAGRTAGVSGRTVGSVVDTTANGLEQYGDDLSNSFTETFSIEPVAGAKDFGSSFVTVFKGVYNIVKTSISGVFGVIYEIGDDIIYTIVPSKSNDSSLNPGEELTIIF